MDPPSIAGGHIGVFHEGASTKRPLTRTRASKSVPIGGELVLDLGNGLHGQEGRPSGCEPRSMIWDGFMTILKEGGWYERIAFSFCSPNIDLSIVGLGSTVMFPVCHLGADNWAHKSLFNHQSRWKKLLFINPLELKMSRWFVFIRR